MIIGIPKEIKDNEYRVAITPAGVRELKRHNHTVLIEYGAGVGSSIEDKKYVGAGAELVDKDELFKRADMVYKVKEILPEEFKYLREGLIIFTYIHSNAHVEQTNAFLKSKAIGISYEDIEDENKKFPLLRPMSEIAGKGGFMAACQFSQKIHGGNGIMLSKVYGIPTPEITVVGSGYAGIGAAELAAGFENNVTLLDISFDKLEQAKTKLPSNVQFLYSNENNIIECLKKSDVLINCVLWPKWRKDHLITRKMLKYMKPGSLIVDVSCDDGGAIETCRSTSHENPVYFEEGIMHYCVDNIPSAFSKTATDALTSSTLPYALEIANKGYKQALIENNLLRKGLCFYFGDLTLEETGKKQNRAYKTPEEVLGI
ncbi:alanine dehydrogenase [Clostridium sp. AWRP]|uniref:alanine dehydrogenase n=1 Tax=Clostridium sp. AWRP TaxID=2212991 RepID=UPI000FD8C8C0|nr:alanine dehydrogenase [Clostridium sp. AWRP]AZV57051.1 alanine dehydrogenase [Clostridium sp. AWRP]